MGGSAYDIALCVGMGSVSTLDSGTRYIRTVYSRGCIYNDYTWYRPHTLTFMVLTEGVSHALANSSCFAVKLGPFSFLLALTLLL